MTGKDFVVSIVSQEKIINTDRQKTAYLLDEDSDPDPATYITMSERFIFFSHGFYETAKGRG